MPSGRDCDKCGLNAIESLVEARAAGKRKSRWLDAAQATAVPHGPLMLSRAYSQCEPRETPCCPRRPALCR